MQTEELLKQVRIRLERQYGDRMKAVILYGSQARGQARPDSDIDLLVVLDGPVALYKEIRRITRALYPLQLEACDRPISAIPADAAEFFAGKYALYRTVKREGVHL